MKGLSEFLKKFFSNISQFWTSQSNVKKIFIGGTLGLLLVGVFSLFALRKSEPYAYLFDNMSSEDTQAVSNYLKQNGYPFIADGNGVKVHPDRIVELRIKLSQEGLPNQGHVGWEQFDTQDFTRTEFERNIHKLRAIQGELGRTIAAIDGIMTARVHVVMPQESLFVEDHEEPTASIYIKTKRGTTLNKKQISGIQHLVSRSVAGLKPFNITIIDSQGKMLTDVESQDFTAKMTKEMLSYKSATEKELVSRIKTIVGRVVGPDRVEARVDVLVDFTQEQQTISNVDPDRFAVLSKNTTGFSMEGRGLNPTGIPGAKSNVPGEQENPAGGGASSGAESKRNSELINYEVSKTVSQKTMPIGNVLRISAAVLVDGKQVYPIDGSKPDFEARPENEMNQITDLVKNAIGFNQERGDVVTVKNMMFELDPFQVQESIEQRKEDREYISTLAISGAIAVALVLFFAFIVRPYFRWLSYDPERKKSESIIEEFKPDLELSSVQNVQIKEDVPFDKLSPQDQIVYLAKHEPKRTTEALRIMLSPNGTAPQA